MGLACQPARCSGEQRLQGIASRGALPRLGATLEVESPTHCRAVFFHIKLEAVESVAVFIIKVEITVTNIDAGPVVEPIGKRASEDGHQISAHAKAAKLGRPCEGLVAAPDGRLKQYADDRVDPVIAGALLANTVSRAFQGDTGGHIVIKRSRHQLSGG